MPEIKITAEILRKIRLLIDSVKRTQKGKRLSKEQESIVSLLADSGGVDGIWKKGESARWTVMEAAANFSMDRTTLSNRIKSKGILPGSDGKFSTMQICDAKYSNAEDARTELYREQAELTKVKKMKIAGSLVYAEQVEKLWSAAIIDIRQKILDSEIPPKEKENLLKEIREIPIEEYAIEITPDPAEDSEEVSEVV